MNVVISEYFFDYFLRHVPEKICTCSDVVFMVTVHYFKQLIVLKCHCISAVQNLHNSVIKTICFN